MRVLDLFTGYGGFSIAFERAGAEIVAHSEIEPFPCAVLEERFPGVPNLGDITKHREWDYAALGEIDVVTFGFPCQGLSVAGRRLGLADERSNLFYEAIGVVRRVRPGFAVLENVPGLFSSARGHDFAAVLDALAECGAMDISWRILDSQHAGVPQRRRRVFLVADFGGERAGEILFEQESEGRDTQAGKEARQEAAADAGTSLARNGQRTFRIAPPIHGYAHGNNPNFDDASFVAVPECIDVRNLSAQGGVSGTLQSKNSGGHSLNYINPVAVPGVVSDQPNDPAPALTAKMAKGAGGPAGDECQNLVLAFHTTQDPISGDKSPALGTGNRQGISTTGVGLPRPSPAYSLKQGQTGANGQGIQEEKTHTLDGSSPPAVAFQQNQRDEVRLMGGDGQTAGALASQSGMKNTNYVAAFSAGQGASAGSVGYEEGRSPNLKGEQSGTNSTPPLHSGMTVRRLTPGECEKLQGLPPGWTNVLFRGKPAADGPRYRALGNGIAVPCVEGFAHRIARVLASSNEK